MAKAKPQFWRSLYFQVLVGIALGVLVGWLWPDWGCCPSLPPSSTVGSGR